MEVGPAAALAGWTPVLPVFRQPYPTTPPQTPSRCGSRRAESRSSPLSPAYARLLAACSRVRSPPHCRGRPCPPLPRPCLGPARDKRLQDTRRVCVGLAGTRRTGAQAVRLSSVRRRQAWARPAGWPRSRCAAAHSAPLLPRTSRSERHRGRHGVPRPAGDKKEARPRQAQLRALTGRRPPRASSSAAG